MEKHCHNCKYEDGDKCTNENYLNEWWKCCVYWELRTEDWVNKIIFLEGDSVDKEKNCYTCKYCDGPFCTNDDYINNGSTISDEYDYCQCYQQYEEQNEKEK